MSSTAVQQVGPSPTAAIDETICGTIRGLRSARQVEVPELARLIGVSRGSFYNRLKGAAPFLGAELYLLAQFFDVPVTDFYQGIVRINPAAANAVTDIGTRG